MDSLRALASNKDVKIRFGFDQQKIDSLLVAGVSDAEIYREMGMKDDAGWMTQKLYAQALRFFKSWNGGAISKAFFDSIPIAIFVLLPIFALLLKLFYYKRGPFVYHLVFAFYYFSFLFLVFSLILFINFIFDIPDRLDLLIMLSTFFYLLWGIRRFYSQSWRWSIIKSGIITFMFLMLVLPLAFGVMVFTAFMMY